VLPLYLFFGIYGKGGDNKVSCLLNSSIEFPTLLSIEVTQKRKEALTVPNFIFQRVANFTIFEHKWAVVSSQLYCRSTVVGAE
jgi:hypothetical protein